MHKCDPKQSFVFRFFITNTYQVTPDTNTGQQSLKSNSTNTKTGHITSNVWVSDYTLGHVSLN